MPTQRLTVEERAVISRARSGAKASGSFRGSSGVSSTPAQTHPYPAASAKTLSLREHTELKKIRKPAFPSQFRISDCVLDSLLAVGQIDALLKAPPPPPKWALLRALSILEEEEAAR